MKIQNIQDAKKYLNKKIYDVDTSKKVPITLHIGGVDIFYNQVNYEVTGFYLYEDKNCQKCWGAIKKENIKTGFNKDDSCIVYTFSYELAKQYLAWNKISKEEREKRIEIKYAKKLLDKYKIKYEIFD